MPEDNRLIFPSDLASAEGHRIIVQFSINGADVPFDDANFDSINIWFPCPTNLLFQNNATYTDTDIGNISQPLIKGASQGVGGTIDMIKNIASSISGFDVARILIGKGNEVFDTTKLGFASQMVTNPRTNTTFDKNTTRAYEFSFSCIARNAKESSILKSISSRFRKYTYARSLLGEDSLSLRYPPTWEIKFIDLSNQKEAEFIPKIWACYLEAFSTTINSGNNTWHKDGAPFQVDLACTFRETKVLTQAEIEELENERPDRNKNDIRGSLNEALGSQLKAFEQASKESQTVKSNDKYKSTKLKGGQNPNARN